MKIARLFIFSVAIILLCTAVAKFVSSTGHSKILFQIDPLTGFEFRTLFCIAGTMEVFVALVCIFSTRIDIRAGLVAWLGTSFLGYRVGLVSVGWHKPCSCLGNFTDALHIPPQVADMTMKIVLAYLLIGSYVILFWLWRNGWKPIPKIKSSETLV